MWYHIFKLADNLLAAAMYYPYKMVRDYIKAEPEVRKLFKMLYDENILLKPQK